jgi:hypothetical protein
MSDAEVTSPFMEPHDPEQRAYDEDAPSLDSEVDFDDEREDDQLLLDVVEAAEAGVLLDSPDDVDDEAEE